MQTYHIAIELGGTKQQIAVGDSEGKPLFIRCDKFSLTNGAETIRNWLLAELPAVISRYNSNDSRVENICVGFGGPIETATGKILVSVQVPGWENFMLKNWCEEQFGVNTIVLNDTVAGGYGEFTMGSGVGSKVFFYTNIGTGIGGALFINGEYYDGTGTGAAYFGNTYTPDFFGGGQGGIIKLENYCSGAAIERRLRTPGYVDGSTLNDMCNGDTATLSCAMLDSAARQGDAFALAEIDRIARVFAFGLGNFFTLISPDVIAVGGGVGNMGDLLLDPVREYCKRIEFISVKDRYRIVQSALRDDIVILGALLYASRMD